MMGRRMLIIWHLAAHAVRGSIKIHIPYFYYSLLQNTISQLV